MSTNVVSNSSVAVINHRVNENICGKRARIDGDNYNAALLGGKLSEFEYRDRMEQFEKIAVAKGGKFLVFIIATVVLLIAWGALYGVFSNSCYDDPNGNVTSTINGKSVRQTCTFNLFVFLGCVFGSGIAYFIFVPVFYHVSTKRLHAALKDLCKSFNMQDSMRGINWRWSMINEVSSGSSILLGTNTATNVLSIDLEIKI